jgi:hypothetical protein
LARPFVALFVIVHADGPQECKKNPFGKPANEAKTIGVLGLSSFYALLSFSNIPGAGLMGAGIAQVSVAKGYQVLLKVGYRLPQHTRSNVMHLTGRQHDIPWTWPRADLQEPADGCQEEEDHKVIVLLVHPHAIIL